MSTPEKIASNWKKLPDHLRKKALLSAIHGLPVSRAVSDHLIALGRLSGGLPWKQHVGAIGELLRRSPATIKRRNKAAVESGYLQVVSRRRPGIKACDWNEYRMNIALILEHGWPEISEGTKTELEQLLTPEPSKIKPAQNEPVKGSKCASHKDLEEKQKTNSKPRPQAGGGKVQPMFELDSACQTVIAELERLEGGRLPEFERRYAALKVEEYANRYKRPNTADALSYAITGRNNRIGIERRSAQIATARDQYAKATREKLQQSAARIQPEEKHKPGSWEWYRKEYSWTLVPYPFPDDQPMMTEEGLYREWLQKFGHEQGQSITPAGGGTIVESTCQEVWS